jgi:hypothetical protein
MILILCLVLQVLLVKSEWETLVPPSSSRGHLLDVSSRCSPESCEAIFSWSGGDIFAVDLIKEDMLEYHTRLNPSGFDQSITAVTYSTESRYLMISASNGTIFYLDLEHSGYSNAWEAFTVPGLTEGVAQMIPWNSVEGTDLLLITKEGSVFQVDPVYRVSRTIFDNSGTSGSVTSSIIVNRNQISYLWLGFSDGVLFEVNIRTGELVEFWAPWDSPITQMLTYQFQGTTWMIVAQREGQSGTVSIIDPTTDDPVIPLKTFNIVPIAMTIMPDLQLIDWLVIATAQGEIVKYDLDIDTFSQPLSFNIFAGDQLSDEQQIFSLQTNWMNNFVGSSGRRTLPVLLAMSKLGSISMLSAASSEWVNLVDPADLDDRNATIMSGTIVTSSFDIFGSPTYNYLLALDDGHILISEDLDTGFTTGLPSIGSERFIKKQESYLNGQPSKREAGENAPVDLPRAVSFTELVSLINMDKEVHITLTSSSSDETLEFRVVGYEIESNPFRQDNQNVILLPLSSSGAGISEGVGFSFWSPEEISQGFDTLVKYVDVGMKIFDFVWTATSIFL